MVEKLITPRPNVVDFVRYRLGRGAGGRTLPLSARACRHCGAALSDGESEDDCSSAFNIEALSPRVAARKFSAD
jgi:hypothetical protein